MITLYSADKTGVAENCSYPHKTEVVDADSLKAAVRHDYVCAEYRNNYRSSGNFIGADCLPVDCDNDHTDNEEDWVYPSDVADAFPGVTFAVHYSRNHMKEKRGKAARPKFHVLFAIDRMIDATAYANLKRQVHAMFPYFDEKALDAARFFYGTPNPNVEIFEGVMTLNTYLADEFDADMDGGSYGDTAITEGSRNATMSHYAGRLLKRYGDTAEAHEHFLEIAQKCTPPLEDEELDTIWKSARRFYGKVAAQEGYISPDKYNADFSLKPTDYSDVGQAVVLSREYADRLRYSPATDYLVYNGRYWEESKPKSQAVAHELTARQLEDAETEIKKAVDEMVKNGAWDLLATKGKKAVAGFNAQQECAYRKYETAVAYRNFAIKRRDSKYIASALKEAHPMLEIEQKLLDADEFMLNTPSRTYVFHADTEGLNFRKAFNDAGFYLSGCCIWKKPSLVLGRSPYQWQHEPCLFGWKKSGKHQWYSDRKQTTIWEFDKPKKNADHPTMKPIPLLCYPITNSSMSNTLVLDPFGGSGSTLIACEQTDRSCCTIELDEKFCDVIVRRYIEQVGGSDGVSLLRDGMTYTFEEVPNATE